MQCNSNAPIPTKTKNDADTTNENEVERKQCHTNPKDGTQNTPILQLTFATKGKSMIK